jgi:hypothetical protein
MRIRTRSNVGCRRRWDIGTKPTSLSLGIGRENDDELGRNSSGSPFLMSL